MCSLFGSLTRLQGVLLGEETQSPSCGRGSNTLVVRKRAVIGAVSLSLGISESCFGSVGTGQGCSLLVLQIVPGAGGGGDRRATDGIREEFKKAVVQRWLV